MGAPESVIEIGSTGVRLLVSELTADRKQNILDRSEMPLALGRDVFTTGSIRQETQNELIQVLKRYKEQLAGWDIQPSQVSCIALSAFRDANNRDPVMDRILVQTGFRVHIVDGIEEIKLMYLAIADCLKDEQKFIKRLDSVILEVGGSTTQLMLLRNGKMAGAHCLQLGTVRIEQHMKAQTSSYDDIQRFVQESIQNTKGSLDSELNISEAKQFIAIGKDVSMAAIYIGRPISTFLWEMDAVDFSAFVQDIQAYSVDECVARFKISYNEAETLHVSLMIYNLFIKLTKVEKIIVPETNIRNGVLLSKSSTINEELQKEFDSQITASARNVLLKYHGDIKHAECVRTVSLKIYDEIKDEVSLPEHTRVLLEVAAILHDIGVFIRYDDHNLHSGYIIKNSEIFGLSRDDRTIISLIAKYHRGSTMPQDEESFRMLPRQDRMTILKLTSILRLADALDRSHLQKCSDISIKIQQNSFYIRPKNTKNTVLEKIAITEKSGMFENVFGYKVILV